MACMHGSSHNTIEYSNDIVIHHWIWMVSIIADEISVEKQFLENYTHEVHFGNAKMTQSTVNPYVA